MTTQLPNVPKLALIADDSIFHYTELALERTHFVVTSVSNETELFNYLDKHSPHIAVVHFKEDMRRSIECIAAIQTKDPTVCTLYFTAYQDLEVHKRAVKAGAYVAGSRFQVDYFGGGFDVLVRNAYEESVRRKHAAVRRLNVLVLMPFSKEFDEIYQLGIKEPMEEAGFVCERVDEIQFAGDILDQIFLRIQASHFLVADMTGRNANVFYEVGYSHAHGKSVILLTQTVEDIPFDLRRHRHIVYGGKIALLRDELVPTSIAVKEQFDLDIKGALQFSTISSSLVRTMPRNDT